MAKKRGRTSTETKPKAENEDAEWEEVEGEVIPDDADVRAAATPQRDWRDLERYIEERDLKRQLQDNFWIEDDRPSKPATGARRKR